MMISRPYRVYECSGCEATDITDGQPVGRSTARYGLYHTCPVCGKVVLTKLERRIVRAR